MKGNNTRRLMNTIKKAMVTVFMLVIVAASSSGTLLAATQPVLSKSSQNILVGKTYKLEVKNKVKKSTYTWSSSSKKTATVDSQGTVKGIKAGNAVITCIVKTPTKKYTLKCNVTIIKPAASFSIINKISALNLGRDYHLRSLLEPAASNDKVTWTSSNTSIAAPDKNGAFTALKEGTVTITGKTISGKSDSVTIKVMKMTTISVYRETFNIAYPDADEISAVQNAINDYVGDKLNIQIELNDINSMEYQSAVESGLADNKIDLFFTASWHGQISCDNLVKQSDAFNLTDILPEYGIYKAMPEWIWDSSAYDGKNYFIPCYKEAAEGYSLMLSKALADMYNWDLSKVKELKDIEPMLEDCKADGLKYPYLLQRTPMFNRYYLNQYDFISDNSFMAVDKEKDAVVNTLPTSEYKEFCGLMGDWVLKGYISPDETADSLSQIQDWGFSWCFNMPDKSEANRRYNEEVIQIKLTDNWIRSNTSLGSCYCLASTCTKTKVSACLNFLSLLYTDNKLANLYTFGLEGTDYTIVNGKIQKTGASLYNHSSWESASVTILTPEEFEPDNKAELYSDYNANAKESIADGFRFDLNPVGEKYEACRTIYNELGYALESGAYAAADVPAAIEAYQASLNEAGYQDVLAEAQRQYEAWKKIR